jgi:fluoroacetyl-CoA thioesterase
LSQFDKTVVTDATHESAILTRRVTEADTAAQFGAAFPPAASTPFVLGLAEVACHEAVSPSLEDGQITVGTSAHIEHLAPTPVGDELTAEAILRDRRGGRLDFEVEIRDRREVVARVRHSRAIVDRQRMLDRLTR